MTSVRCLIKYSPNTIEVTNAVMDRLDFWRKATDGIGRFKLKLLGDWDGQFAADDPIQIRLDDIVVFEGYIDQGVPLALGDVYNQFYEIVGRDYGQDLLNKQVNKSGVWIYKTQYADLIIDDMLSKANSEITFTPSGDHKYGSGIVIPSIAYTDQGDEYLLEAFRKIFEQINYDFYVDANKALQIFPIGTYDSGIDLKCVEGAEGNNLLNLRKTEFDTYDVRNYIIAKADRIDDGWTDGNAANFTGGANNTISDDFTIVNKGAGSIKCTKGAGADCRIILTLPKHNYTNLPMDLINEDVMRIGYRYTGNATGFMILLEDDAGNKIEWKVPSENPDVWYQLSVPVGKLVTKDIHDYLDWMGISHNDSTNEWQYESGYSTFNWKVVKITFLNWGTVLQPTALWIDSLTLPFPMVSYKQDAPSQGLYGVRKLSFTAKNIKTQAELDAFAASELAKSKDPLYALHVTALGSAGIIGGAFKWVPGWIVNVNSPADGISNVDYRISEVHCIVSEQGQSGHDFIVEGDLVPWSSLISGRRLSDLQDPKVALLRGINDKLRYLEKVESIYTDYLPPLPSDAAKKIQVGTFGTLAETVVAWTKLWEAEDVTADAAWAITADSASSKGYCRKMGPALTKIIYFTDGVLGCVGEFYILARVKVSDITKAAVVYVSVYDKDTSAVIGYITVTNANFPANDKYHHFALRIELPATTQNVQIRVTGTAAALQTISCDYAAILPASIPLGYTDVSVVNDTQNTSASDATQNSSANNATQNSAANDATQNSSAQSGYMNSTTILDLGTGSEVNCPVGSATVLRYGTCSSEADAINLLVVKVRIERGASGGTGGHIILRINASAGVGPYTVRAQKMLYIDATQNAWNDTTIILLNASGMVVEIMCTSLDNSVYLTSDLVVYQYKVHTHGITNPSHSTGMTNPAHATGMTNPAHATGITNPSHGHGAIDPAHEH
jgi:hypothetical protein